MLTHKKSILLLLAMTFGSFTIMPMVVHPAAAAKTYNVDIWYNNSGHYGNTEASVAQMLKSQLENTGYFSITLKSTDWSSYVGQFGKMPVFLLGWYMDYPDESDYIDPFVGSGAFSLGTNYSSTTMMGYINTMLQSSDPATRASAEKSAQQLMATDAPVIPLFTMTKQFVAYGKDITGVTLEPSEYLRFDSIQKGTSKTGSVTVGTTDSVPYLDPANVYEYWGSNTLIQLSHGLLETPVNSTAATPMVAKSYSISKDGLTYTFNIRPNLKFTDGNPLTVQDVIWSLNRSSSLTAGQPAFLLDGINNQSWNVINNTAFSFKLNAKDGTFLQRLTYTNSFIYEKNATIDNSLQGFGYIPVGLGPYKVTSWTNNEEMDLAVSQYYNATAYGLPAPENSQVIIKFFTTSSNLVTALDSGTVDVGFHTFTPDEIISLGKSTVLNSASKATAGTRYIVINVQAVPDVNVRQAMEYAINRTQFVDQIFNGTNAPLYSMVPTVFPNACDKGSTCAFPSTDLAKVKTLMEPTYGPNAGGSTPGYTFLGLLMALPILALVYKKRKN